jgi:hypothetical protein
LPWTLVALRTAEYLVNTSLSAQDKTDRTECDDVLRGCAGNKLGQKELDSYVAVLGGLQRACSPYIADWCNKR